MHRTRFAAACAIGNRQHDQPPETAGAATARRSPAPILNSRRVVDLRAVWSPDLSAHSFWDSSTGRSTYLVGQRFRVGRLSRNGSKLVDSLKVEEGTQCSRRVAPLRRGNGEVDRNRCLLCLNEDRLRAIRNYSTAATPARSFVFVHGITGSALKKDNVVKHSKSDIHKKAVFLERQPTRTINEILRSTPIGRAVASASSEEKDRISRLFEVAYMISREEMPFTSFLRTWSLTRGTASASDKLITRSSSVKNSRALLERRSATISFRLWGVAGTCPCWWTGRRTVAWRRRSLLTFTFTGVYKR